MISSDASRAGAKDYRSTTRDVQRLIAELGHGDEPVLVRPISPTLEDVFVTLTRAAEDASNSLQLDAEFAAEPASKTSARGLHTL